MTEQLVNEVASRTEEHIFAKFNDTIEKRDCQLEEHQQARIEQVAAQQKRVKLFKKD